MIIIKINQSIDFFINQAIDVWTGMCLTFVFGALLEFALVNYNSRRIALKEAQKKLVNNATHATRRVCDIEPMQPNSNYESTEMNTGMTLNQNSTLPALPGVGFNFSQGPTLQAVINDPYNFNVSFSKVMFKISFDLTDC